MAWVQGHSHDGSMSNVILTTNRVGSRAQSCIFDHAKEAAITKQELIAIIDVLEGKGPSQPE